MTPSTAVQTGPTMGLSASPHQEAGDQLAPAIMLTPGPQKVKTRIPGSRAPSTMFELHQNERSNITLTSLKFV